MKKKKTYIYYIEHLEISDRKKEKTQDARHISVNTTLFTKKSHLCQGWILMHLSYLSKGIFKGIDGIDNPPWQCFEIAFMKKFEKANVMMCLSLALVLFSPSWSNLKNLKRA